MYLKITGMDVRIEMNGWRRCKNKSVRFDIESEFFFMVTELPIQEENFPCDHLITSLNQLRNNLVDETCSDRSL